MTVSLPAARIAAVDLARGVAIVAMVLYHACWDLSHFGLVRFDLPRDALWLAARDGILATFLILVGVGLTLATAAGVRWRRVASRGATIAGAALAVTVVSLWFAPEAPIVFGVLHHIALASLLGLAFVRLPGWGVLLAAAACLAAPGGLAGPAFDVEGLRWLGLAAHETRSNDFVPLLPWFGLVLAGMALGRRLESLPALGGWRPRALPLRALEWGGRHSLALYLAHQPLLLGALWLGMAATGGMGVDGSGGAAAPAVRFLAECQRACEEAGGGGSCPAYCRCVDAGLAENGLWPAFLNERLDPAGQRRVMDIVQSCAVRRGGP